MQNVENRTNRIQTKLIKGTCYLRPINLHFETSANAFLASTSRLTSRAPERRIDPLPSLCPQAPPPVLKVNIWPSITPLRHTPFGR